MATGLVLHPLAQKALRDLQSRMKSEMHRDASDRRLVSALVYGITPAQAMGMLDEFVGVLAAWEVEQEQADEAQPDS